MAKAAKRQSPDWEWAKPKPPPPLPLPDNVKTPEQLAEERKRRQEEHRQWVKEHRCDPDSADLHFAVESLESRVAELERRLRNLTDRLFPEQPVRHLATEMGRTQASHDKPHSNPEADLRWQENGLDNAAKALENQP